MKWLRFWLCVGVLVGLMGCSQSPTVTYPDNQDAGPGPAPQQMTPPEAPTAD